jgi:hypothetical protein
MINPPLEWAIAVATDPATGVNAQLPNVPRPVGRDAAAPVIYYDALQHPWAARAGVIPRDALRDPVTSKPRPGLIIRVVLPEDGILAALLPEFAKENPAIVPVGLIYASRKVAREDTPLNSSVQLRDAYDTLRTVMRCFAQKFEHSNSYYDVDDCTLMLDKTGVILDTDYVDAGDDEILGRLIVPLIVEDRWALGIT